MIQRVNMSLFGENFFFNLVIIWTTIQLLLNWSWNFISRPHLKILKILCNKIIKIYLKREVYNYKMILKIFHNNLFPKDNLNLNCCSKSSVQKMIELILIFISLPNQLLEKNYLKELKMKIGQLFPWILTFQIVSDLFFMDKII